MHQGHTKQKCCSDAAYRSNGGSQVRTQKVKNGLLGTRYIFSFDSAVPQNCGAKSTITQVHNWYIRRVIPVQPPHHVSRSKHMTTGLTVIMEYTYTKTHTACIWSDRAQTRDPSSLLRPRRRFWRFQLAPYNWYRALFILPFVLNSHSRYSWS